MTSTPPIVPRAPRASSPGTAASMRSNRRRDTKPEIAIRRLLFANGHRYRVDFPIQVEGGRPIRPDIVFTRLHVCVFVDGCFWHGCGEHFRLPKANRAYWESKIARNRWRDEMQRGALASEGWDVLRIWEHDSPEVAVEKIEKALGPSARPG